MKISTIEEVRQVVELINRRNYLATQYTQESIFEKRHDYFIIVEEKKVIACGRQKWSSGINGKSGMFPYWKAMRERVMGVRLSKIWKMPYEQEEE